MQGVWCFVLAAYTGQPDVVYGITVSGRPHTLRSAEQGIGLYINTLPLRYRVETTQKVSTWLLSLQEEQTRVREYQHTSLSQIRKWKEGQGDLFDSVLVFENYPIGEALASTSAIKAELSRLKEQSNYLLTITASLGRGFRINFNYNSSLLLPVYVEGIKSHIQNVLLRFISAPEIKLADVAILGDAERLQLLPPVPTRKLHATPLPVVTDWFEQRVALTPDLPALSCENRVITFRQLEESANALAHYLRASHQIVPGTFTGILCDRTERQHIAILAVLKAGGAYVPLDPTYPADRLLFMLENANVGTVLLDSPYIFAMEGFTGELFAMDLQLEGLAPCVSPPEKMHDATDLAYVIYTSGSTGMPKGVMVEHTQLSHYLHNSQDLLQETGASGTGTYLHFPLTFDASITAFYLPLLAGRLTVISTAQPLSIFKDTRFLEHAPYDFIKLTPSHLALLQAAVEGPALVDLTKKYVLGGEALKKWQLQFLLGAGAKAEIINEYGPTENTVGCVTARFGLGDPIPFTAAGISIGKPMQGVHAIVTDSNANPVPVGVPGELWLGGSQVARGYLNKPQLTAEKFILNSVQNRR
jgi:amino acid adenylation domain-containing protein